MSPRAPGQYDADAVSQATGLACKDPTLAQQQFRDDSDINVIVERFGLTGHLPQNGLEPLWGDFSEALDYRSALEAIRRAEAGFMAFPAHIRSRFDNDPQQLMDFLAIPANRQEATDLGLLVKGQPPVILPAGQVSAGAGGPTPAPPPPPAP